MSMTHNRRAYLLASRWQRGLSLVELMVGLTIGLMLTLGLFTLIASSSQAFKVQDDFARMQENATAAMRYLGDSLRLAGFYGYATVPTNVSTDIGGVNVTSDCGSAANPPAANWALSVSSPLSGYNGLTNLTVNGVFPCIKSINFASGPTANPNPILVTRSAGGFRIASGTILKQQPNYATSVYVQSDPNAGLVFLGGNFDALAASLQTRKLPVSSGGGDVDIFEYHTYVYYLRPCSRPAGGGPDCTGPTDDSSSPLPTLVRQELVGTAMTEVPLVEGIDMINYQYGVDSNGDGVPDFYILTPVATDWVNVVSVKVSMVVRSLALSREYDDSQKQYDLVGDGKTALYSCTAYPPPACNYKRKVFSRTFQLCNIAQRRGA
jgi:type IV pilus assembly protein PilW